MQISKKCKTCGNEKFLNEFRNQTRGKHGKKSLCIPCDDEYNKLLYIEKQDLRKHQQKKWNEQNPDKVKKYKENWKDKTNNVIIPD